MWGWPHVPHLGSTMGGRVGATAGLGPELGGAEPPMLALMAGMGTKGQCRGTSGVPTALLDGLGPPPFALLRVLAPRAKGRRWRLGQHCLPRQPTGTQLVGFTGYAAPQLRLGTKPKGHGAIPAGMGHGASVRLGHQP